DVGGFILSPDRRNRRRERDVPASPRGRGILKELRELVDNLDQRPFVLALVLLGNLVKEINVTLRELSVTRALDELDVVFVLGDETRPMIREHVSILDHVKDGAENWPAIHRHIAVTSDGPTKPPDGFTICDVEELDQSHVVHPITVRRSEEYGGCLNR